jgi:hypothetical protein
VAIDLERDENMATANLSPHTHVKTTFNVDHHAQWNRCFSPAEQQRLINDDLLAGRSVPLLLAAIVGIGVVLAILSVWITG